MTKPLSTTQRLATERRKARRKLREHLEDIQEYIARVPENQRCRTAAALKTILGGGPVFAVACAKALISRTWPLRYEEPELWAFIDEQNALFAQRQPADVVQRWNAPDYDLPKPQQPAEKAGVR